MSNETNDHDALYNPIAYIYEMTWYESKRHKNAHTWNYYLHEEDTRWGHDWEADEHSQRCEIRVIKVCVDDHRYQMALHNYNVEQKKRQG